MSTEPTYVWMQRDHLTNLPVADAPAGYRIRPFRHGDAGVWTEIVQHTELGRMFPEATFEKELPGDDPLHASRILFAEDAAGKPVGTITAWFGKDGPAAGWGLVHWFAILPAHRNRGLGRAMLAQALRIMAEFHTGAVLTSEILLTAAIRLYLDAGFEIGINNKAERLAWRKVAGVLNHPGLDAMLDPPPAEPAPDEVVAEIKGAAVCLKGCSAGAGFDDLRPLAALIGEARIVSMGEATHGTREFFQLKHRLLEYLVVEHGFTAFAIEASLPECVMLDRFVTTGEGDPLDGITNMRFWTWNTEEVRDLVLWLRHHNARAARPVRFYGFDMQSPAMAVQDVISNLRRHASARAAGLAVRLTLLADDFGAEAYGSLPPARQADVEDALQEARELLRGMRWTDPRAGTMAELHATVAVQGAEYLRLGYSGGFRDRSMADNLCSLLPLEGPQGRVAAWAHNLHVTQAGTDSMGSHLHRRLGQGHVAVGFAFGSGSFQAFDQTGGAGLRDFTVPPPPTGSLDDTLLRTGLPRFALRLGTLAADSQAGQWLCTPRATRSIGSVYSEEGDGPAWFAQSRAIGECYDVLVFVGETHAARPNPDRRHLGPLSLPRGGGKRLPALGEGLVNGLPEAWTACAPRYRDHYTLSVGDGVATIRRTGVPWPWGFEMFVQAFNAKPYRQQKVRLQAEGRAGVADERAHALLVLASGKGEWAWLLADGLQVMTSTQDQPWNEDRWEFRSVEIEVPTDADALRIAFVLCGNGTAAIRNIRISPAE